jgi:hypothetical protein
MHKTIRKSGENIADVQRWLLTGDILYSHYINMINNDKEKKRISAQVKSMRMRFRRLCDKGRMSQLYFQDFPTQNSTIQLVIDSECRCKITGWVCHRATSRQKAWSLTLNHIVPLSKALPEMNP